MWRLAKEPSDGGSHKHLDYIFITIAFIGVFTGIYISLHKFLILLSREYEMMNNKQRAQYIDAYIAIIHAIAVTFLAFIGIFMTCDKRDSHMLNDQDCLRNPKNFHQFSALVTIGYLVFDFFVCAILIRDNTSLQYQTYAHHIIGASAFYMALVMENNVPLSAAIINQFTEISTPFLNLRQIFFTHKMKESLAFKINTILFFLTFSFGRVCVQIIGSYQCLPWIIEQYNDADKLMPTWQDKSQYIFVIISQIAGLALNFYWLSLILKQLARMIWGSSANEEKAKIRTKKPQKDE
eukprot:403373482